MPNLTVDEIITKKHKRNFIQFGGAKPNNVLHFAGQDAQYLVIGGATMPELGGVEPQWVHDPRVIGQYKLVARKLSPPALAKMSVKLYEKHGSIPRQLTRIGCAFNAYEYTGVCKDLSDVLNGWSDYILVYTGGLVTDKNLGDRTAFNADDAIEDDMSVVLADIYPVGQLNFGEQAAATINEEVVDAIYGSNLQCGDCGPTDDGTQRIYSITKWKAASAGDAADLISTVDGAATWQSVTPLNFPSSTNPVALEMVGSYLVALFPTGYRFCTLDPITGAVPGAADWSTSGAVFTAANDMCVLTPREVFFCANTGVVYKSTNIAGAPTTLLNGSPTVSNLLRISFRENVIVAVGVDGGTATTKGIIKSTDRGATWTAITAPVGSLTYQAVAVLSSNVIWVGTSNGRIFYTINGGSSWIELTFTNSSTGVIEDIIFATDEVGYFSHTVGGVSVIWATWNGGVDWTKSTPRLNGLLATTQKINRMDYPKVDNATAANNLLLSGLGVGVDGFLGIGIASKL